ncbi:helix-turn-helix domain-containing protein [Natronococcus jeotgali]|uniref:DNA binding domain-containing protein n=1 Tax=Natronococcus jeotgali DSM 18795 TaxID=1227498 RepID=L9WTX3_9EURY|nr:helix-turn-helix domain-containing protein [Natronococcus jeotgali]ELY52919.1 DNA binding domain-containing protein [Natronococcus jeotgali DSM 18795]
MGGTVAEIELSPAEFVLEETIEAVDGLECEVERVVANADGEVMPFLWVDAPDLEGIDEALEGDETVDNVELLADVDGERLYRMGWVRRVDALVQMLVEEEGTVLSAVGDADGWQFRLLFPDRDSLSRTNDYCRSNGIRFQLHSIYSLEEGRQGRFGLTDDQQDTLEIAFERGYYEIPREADMMALADELDISHQALSERLRRAHRSLVQNTVVIGREGRPDG